MAIIQWPDDINVQHEVLCIVCGEDVALAETTIGFQVAGQLQAFACGAHLGLGESARFVRAWIDFNLTQHAPLGVWLPAGVGAGHGERFC